MFNNELWQKPASGGGSAFYDYQIANSGRFQLANTSMMARTPSSSGNRSTWTYSTWVKRTKFNINTSFFGGTRSGYENVFRFEDTSGKDQLNLFGFTGSSLEFNIQTKRSFRDSSAWYHIVIAFDTTQGTSTNRIKLYVNGEQQTELKENSYPSQNYNTNINDSSTPMQIGYGSYGGQYFDGYIAESILIDGLQLDASSFGETKNGVWVPKDPSSLTFGTNGFHMNYASAGALGNDVSGNNNDMSTTGLATHDQMTDAPTFGSSSTGNCATLNILTNQSGLTISEGNLKMSRSSAGNVAIPATMGASVGKYYLEIYWNNDTQVGNFMWGFAEPNNSMFGSNTSVDVPNASALQNNSGDTYLNNSVVTMNGTDPTTGTIIGIAIDFDNGKIFYGQDGGSGSRSMNWNISSTGTGVPEDGTNPAQTFTAGSKFFIPAFSASSIGDTNWILNFGQSSAFSGALTSQGNTDDNGQGDFYYSPPTGYSGWTAGGLKPASTIDPAQTDINFPQKLFGAKLYTGNGGTNVITGLGFKPDVVWGKSRANAENHFLADSTNGTGKTIIPDGNFVQQTENGVTAFGADGWTMGSVYNTNAYSYVGWTWRANGGTTTNGSGDLTSTQQVDPSGGFSIVKAVGSGSGDRTVSHGLSAAPTCIIAKNLDAAYNWDTFWSEGLTATSYSLRLNTTDAQLSGRWGTVNSSIFTCKENYTWAGTNNFIYYCFTNTEGYIKSGSYIGNGNNDGTFVYTGFKPSFILLKETGTDSWGIYDDKRLGYNLDSDGNAVLYPESNGVEEGQATRAIDLLSNGFKLRTDNITFNQSGQTLVYLAMAENPFKYATAR